MEIIVTTLVCLICAVISAAARALKADPTALTLMREGRIGQTAGAVRRHVSWGEVLFCFCVFKL